MTNIKKLGLTALAGSLAATSAFAGALDVTGTAKVVYASQDESDTTGNPWSMNQGIAFGGSGDLEFRLLSASVHNSGAILVLKDENSSRGAAAITISASSPNTIDNNGAYVLSGSNPAISLYSNGSNWFVF